MLAAIVDDQNIIINVIEVEDSEDLSVFGSIELPEGLWIGDKIPIEPTDTEVLNTLLGVI